MFSLRKYVEFLENVWTKQIVYKLKKSVSLLSRVYVEERKTTNKEESKCCR